jgi:methyl-accepting chemotaxis protein
MPVLSEADINQRSRIVDSLHSLVERTEKIYLRMGQTLPDVLRELDRGFGEARTLVGYFMGRKTDSKAPASEGDMVGDVLQDARAVIAEASSFFSSMEESDQVSFQSINGGIQNLSLLDEKLKAIREDSEEMELISLNAMTVALKAGQAGRAFSVITEELKALSSETITFTEKLTGDGRKILELFFEFRRDVEKIQKFQEDFYAGFRTKLESSFENFRLGVGKMAEILLQVIDGAGGTKTPLIRIMEEVQSQDIIRQSIQHVVLSLSEDGGNVPQANDDWGDEQLDELSFSAMLPDLSRTLLKDVEANIGKGLTIFRENLKELRTSLEDAEQEKQVFVEYFGTGENALEKMFEESIEGMSGLLESVERSMTEKAKLSPEGGRILEELKTLQESFEDFVSFVDRFRTVDIAARIELAKQEILRAKRDTMGSLRSLAGRIGVDVKAALDIILQTIDRIESTIKRFGGEVTRGSARVSTLVVSIRGVYARLTQAKDFLSHTMREFSLYSRRFFSLIDELEASVGELSEMIALIGRAVSDITELRAQLLARKEAALSKRGLSSWTIHSGKLQNMIEKFTILSHKKTAAELGGIAVEEGSHPGELTLF